MLKQRGLLEKSMLAVNVGWPEEQLYRDLSALPEDFDPGYFALIIVKD